MNHDKVFTTMDVAPYMADHAHALSHFMQVMQTGRETQHQAKASIELAKTMLRLSLFLTGNDPDVINVESGEIDTFHVAIDFLDSTLSDVPVQTEESRPDRN